MPRLISSSPSSSRILHGSRPKLPFSTIFPGDCDTHRSSPLPCSFSLFLHFLSAISLSSKISYSP